jgi:hypothetical protein
LEECWPCVWAKIGSKKGYFGKEDRKMCETRISSLLGKITLIFVVCLFAMPAQAKYGGGTGEPNDPYLIYDANQMNAIGADQNDWDKHFKLMADIDLGCYVGEQFNIIGTGWDNPFAGVFDGNGRQISNFSYSSTEYRTYVGLFGMVLDGEIKNLGLIDPNIDPEAQYDGSLVGYLTSGIVINCYAEGGSVAGSRRSVGGLVGTNGSGGTITNCHASCTVLSSSLHTGGLVGMGGGRIANSYTSGDVFGDNYVGGLVGRNNEGTINNCYSSGSVTAQGDNVGGLVGNNIGTISDCYSSVQVSGKDFIGGLVGRNGDLWDNVAGAITNCYSVGWITGGPNIGGLVGSNEYGAVVFSFWDTETSGQSSSSGASGRTTAEMQMESTYLGWNGCGEIIWTIDEGNDYPRFLWESRPGQPLPEYQLGDFLQGSGSEIDPYLVYNAEQLNMIGLFLCEWDKYFKLMADIDLSGYEGDSFNIIGYYVGWDSPDNRSFYGVFDGNGHTINNFNWSSASRNYVGIFGYVSHTDAQIKDLGMINPNIDAGDRIYVGALIGLLRSASLTASYVDGGSVTGKDYVGGLVGTNMSGIISNCYATNTVTGYSSKIKIGGLVGQNYSGVISSCHSSGIVELGGGLVGHHRQGLITKSYSTATVGNRLTSGTCGGLVGCNTSTIEMCYSTGYVSAKDLAGGLVGYNEYRITDCYSTGDVENRYNETGGLVGRNYYGWITNSYSTGAVSGQYQTGGLVGTNNFGIVRSSFWDVNTSGLDYSDGGVGKTTVEMQTKSTFSDALWDFVGEDDNGTEYIWRLCVDGTDYPKLSWQFLLGDFLCPDGVNFVDYSFFAGHWAEDNCGALNDCDGTDLDLLGTVEINDLRIYVDNWLIGF